MASDTVKAIWQGPFEAELPDRTVLVPGQTVVEIPREEAEGSDYWKVTEAKKAKPVTESPAIEEGDQGLRS